VFFWHLMFDVYHFSPSDLEADLEDNQDYDSAVSQSDAYVINSQSATRDAGQPSSPAWNSQSATRDAGQARSPAWNSQSKFSSHSSTYKPPQTQTTKPSQASSSVQHNVGLTRKSSYDSDRSPVFQPSQPKSPRSPRSPKQSNFAYEPPRSVTSVLSRYQDRDKPEAGYRSHIEGVRGPIGQHYVSSLVNKDHRDDDMARKKLEKVRPKTLVMCVLRVAQLKI